MSDFPARARMAEAAMRTVFPATPLQHNRHLSDRFGADIWLKREDLSPVRSYKLRGAFNAMRKQPDHGLFVCASAGNHAQGVAFMCRHMGVRGVIFMPVTTPEQKILKTRMFGGDRIEIHLVGDYFDDTLAAAQQWCAVEGGHFLSPFDDPDVIEGQASVAVEIEMQLGRAPGHVVLPVGGGGMSSGVATWFGDRARCHFVEPAGGACLRAALETGAPVALDIVDNFVDGAAVGRIGDRPFELLRHVPAEDVVVLGEDRICATMMEMLNVEGIVLEPAGALSVEALGDLRDAIRGQTVVCVTSGGNFDFERLPEVKERAQRWSGRKKYFILRLPQRPGALREFLAVLGPDDDIARFEYLKKSARNFGSVLIGIETSRPENFDALFARLDDLGFTYSDITNDEILAQFVI
ncbi:threonine ammonia-lyase IlvA [Pukyongiella litopenaei]|uniref:L-threonine dehydratase n=1 Tax=Pukyongiella litopenaei TaxID=2605946 RepID=A0A2S0MPT8_9RHOB|nr:threonine ammonia-lyase IlvA [Pukyongiella litopenaei]AVO37857.1 threonine ammonia-lyase IlvA [Pukyongiella litopenaei]